jgi:hypothetical protein
MMFAINKDNFNGHREVTCYSCHDGTADPVGTPLVADEEPKPEPRGAMNAGGTNPVAIRKRTSSAAKIRVSRL